MKVVTGTVISVIREDPAITGHGCTWIEADCYLGGCTFRRECLILRLVSVAAATLSVLEGNEPVNQLGTDDVQSPVVHETVAAAPETVTTPVQFEPFFQDSLMVDHEEEVVPEAVVVTEPPPPALCPTCPAVVATGHGVDFHPALPVEPGSLQWPSQLVV